MTNTNFYNRKCKGCGSYFSDDPKATGYVKNLDKDTIYCTRCFQFKNYGSFIQSEDNNSKVNDVLKSLAIEKDLVIMIIDLFDIENTIIEEFKHYSNLLVVVNKLSCLPKKFNFEVTKKNLLSNLKKFNVNCRDIILYDAYEKKNISTIMREIEKAYFRKEKIYLIGKTNVGKSSLINALLTFNKQNSHIVISPYPNTTIGLIKIDLNRTTIIDTPGYPNQKNILNLLDKDSLNKISKNKRFISKNFRLTSSEQIFFIEDFFRIKFILDESEGNACFYLNSIFTIHRAKINNLDSILKNKNKIFSFFLDEKIMWKEKTIQLDPNLKHNIIVPGISIISLKKVKEITFSHPSNISIYVTENAII